MSTPMFESVVGRVASVDDKPAGSSMLTNGGIGETTIYVFDAADFPEDGGTVDIAGNLHAYSTADLDADTLTLTDPLVDITEVDTPVLLVPHAPTRVAVVEVDGSDEPITALVPQSLLDQLPVGLRDLAVAETVTVAVVDGAWTVRDIVATADRTVKAGSPWVVTDEHGETQGGLVGDGSAEVPEVRTGRLLLAGVDALTLLERREVHLGEDRTPAGVVYGPYTVDMPLWEGVIDVPAGHRVQLHARGWTQGNAGGAFNMQATYTVTADGSMPPVPGGGVGTGLDPHAPFHHASARWEARSWSWSFGAGSTDARFRVLVWLQPDPGGTPISARDFVFEPIMSATHGVREFAGQVRAQPGSQSTTPPPPATPPLQPASRTFDLGPAHALYSGGTHITIGVHLAYVALGWTGSNLYRTFLTIPSAARTFAASLEDQVEAEVFLSVDDAYGGAITPYFATSTSSSLSAPEPSRTGRAAGSRSYSESATSGWSTLGAATVTRLRAQDPTLCVDWNTTRQPFIRFHGPGARSSARPKIRITGRTRT